MASKMAELVREFCEMHGLDRSAQAELMGRIAAAEIVDAIANPDLSRRIADFANGEGGAALRKMSRRKRKRGKIVQTNSDPAGTVRA